MRLDEDTGEPLVHRVESPQNPQKEAQMGLDLLLKQAAALRDREKVRAAAKALQDESDAIRARRMRMAQIQADRFEWRPVAAVALFERQVCKNCGSEATMFRGFGTLLQQKASFIERVAAAECLDHGLPFQKKLLEGKTPYCARCIDDVTEPFVGEPAVFYPHKEFDDGTS